MRVRGRRGRQNIGFVLESQSCYSALGFSHFLAHFILVSLFSLTDITNIRSGSVNNTLFFHSLCSLSCGFYQLLIIQYLLIVFNDLSNMYDKIKNKTNY